MKTSLVLVALIASAGCDVGGGKLAGMGGGMISTGAGGAGIMTGSGGGISTGSGGRIIVTGTAGILNSFRIYGAACDAALGGQTVSVAFLCLPV